jgi:HAE1 family hydrophobic/amphiphilic exporter-1
MGLPDFSVKRPVTTVMLFIGIILFGLISLMKLRQELFPPIEYPQLTVFTVYANAAPEEVETLITKPIEEAVGTVSGLRSVRSLSREGISLVFAEFSWDQNMDFAALRMREKIDLIKARLPRDCSEPLVVPYNPFETPVMTISVTGDRSPQELRRIAVETIKEELEKVEGVASAGVEGGLDREILVEVNQNKIKSYDVPILDISDSVTNSNLNYPAGTIKESFYEYLIRTLGEFEKVEEIDEVVVKGDEDEEDSYSFDERLKKRELSRAPRLVMMKDIAKVSDTVKERSSFSRLNGKENISINIQKQGQANTIQVVDSVIKSFSGLKKRLPEDIRLEVVYDQSIFIKDAIRNVADAGWQGGLLAFVVLLAFLRNITAALIVIVTIPISVIVTFTFLYFYGFTLNIMSLGGLALGIGMLVDGSIVVIENIFQHLEKGEDPRKAAVDATNEVANAVNASVLTTVAVFLPMIFVIGVAGQLFKELAFTVTVSLMASLWVAFTLIPLLTYRFLGGTSAANVAKIFSPGRMWVKGMAWYKTRLLKFLKIRRVGVASVFILFAISMFFGGYLEKEAMPKADMGEFAIKLEMPVGTKVEETDKMVLKIEGLLLKDPIIRTVSTVVGASKGETAKDMIKSMGSHQATVIVVMKEKAKMTTFDVVKKYQREFASRKYAPAKIKTILQQGVIGGAVGEGGKPITVEVKGEKIDEMIRIVRDVEGRMKNIAGIADVEDDVPESAPEIRIKINKDKASLYGISVVDLAKIAQMVLKGYISSQFKEKGKEVDIRVVMRKKDREDFTDLHNIQVHSPTHGAIPLGSIVTLEKGLGPSEIKRVRQERTITISANCIGRKTSAAMSDVEKMIKKLKLDPGYRVKMAGASEEMKKSFDSLMFALLLSVVLVYMIMAAQFESIVQPFIILITVPLGLIGVVAALFISGTSLNVVSILGVIILGGVVVDNGIVLIDYMNILVSRGAPLHEALIDASVSRLRPIMMTAMATVLGLIPMAFAQGRGAELSAPMAVSVMGGLTLATFLTLFIIPSMILLQKGTEDRLKRFFQKLNFVPRMKDIFSGIYSRIILKKKT